MKILICGTLPPPKFGHSMLYEALMSSSFAVPEEGGWPGRDSIDVMENIGYDIQFLNMDFFSYDSQGNPTVDKIIKMIKYWIVLIVVSLVWQPKYVLYNASWYQKPFWKDMLFMVTALVLRRKLVIHDHGQYVSELDMHTYGFKNKVLRWVLRHATATIVLGKNIIPKYRGLMEPNKIFVMPPGMKDSDNVVVHNTPKYFRSRINILYFSAITKDKGALIAFDVARSILERYQNVTFTFAGPVADDVRIRFNAILFDYPERIKETGYVDSEVCKVKLMRKADIFLFPTQREAFGLVLLEAMREGLPIVASKEGCIPEILSPSAGGIFTQKDYGGGFVTHLERLINDKQLREELGQRNRKRYEEFYTIEKYGQRMIDCFKEIDANINRR